MLVPWAFVCRTFLYDLTTLYRKKIVKFLTISRGPITMIGVRPLDGDASTLKTAYKLIVTIRSPHTQELRRILMKTLSLRPPKVHFELIGFDKRFETLLGACLKKARGVEELTLAIPRLRRLA